jgi:1-phosphofructokinase family hexose kinase
VPGHAPAQASTLVLTVTPNPSLDLLFATERLVWDDANRLADPRRRPGGQGINVTRAARALGARSEAVALLGGRTGSEIAEALRAEGTPLWPVPAAADTRTFVAVRETGTGHSLLLNARGQARSDGEVEALAEAVEQALAGLRPEWLACCGSLPAGFPPDFYVRLMARARAHGCRVVVDCDGEPLRLAAEAGCDLLVPNQHEAERLAGCPADAIDAATAAARELCRRGTPLVAVTLGAAGALLANPRDVRAGRVRPFDVPPGASAVGAGDAFLAGLLVALRHASDLGSMLRHAVAAGSAVLLSSGSTLVAAQDVDRLLPDTTIDGPPSGDA